MRAVADFSRDLAKRLPYPLFLRVFLRTNQVRERSAEALIQRCGVPLLRPGVLEAGKTSDVLFVLGSGPSINRISPERWRAIAQHDSAGLNFWLFHPFVPRFYFFESIGDFEPGYNEFLAVAGRRAADYREVIKVVTFVHGSGQQTFGQVFQGDQNFYAASALQTPARNEREIGFAIEYLARRGAFDAGAGRQPFFKHASSLSLMISVATCMGYKKIVLCGVDLKTQEYFYQDPKLFPEGAKLETAPRAQVHATQVAQEWLVPISIVLERLRVQVLKPRGIELYVEHRGSVLWPAIEEAPEALFAGVAPVSSR